MTAGGGGAVGGPPETPARKEFRRERQRAGALSLSILKPVARCPRNVFDTSFVLRPCV